MPRTHKNGGDASPVPPVAEPLAGATLGGPLRPFNIGKVRQILANISRCQVFTDIHYR